MLTIYCCDRLGTAAENTLAYLVAERQPLAGGCDDTDEGRARSAQIIVPVHQVETIEQARLWIDEQLAALPMSYLPGVTQPAYTIREVPHSQAVLCIVAEGVDEDEE